MPQPPIDHEALRERFNPEGSLLRRMQHRMTEMLGEIDKICRRHNLKYWLCSGTLLGCAMVDIFLGTTTSTSRCSERTMRNY